MRERDLARPRGAAAAEQAGRARGVVGSPEGALAGDRHPLPQEPGGAVDARHLERLVEGERREQAAHALREHGLAAAGRALQEQRVPAGGGDLERRLRALLPAHLGEVGQAARLGR